MFNCQASAHFSLDLNIQIYKPAKLGSHQYSAVKKIFCCFDTWRFI